MEGTSGARLTPLFAEGLQRQPWSERRFASLAGGFAGIRPYYLRPALRPTQARTCDKEVSELIGSGQSSPASDRGGGAGEDVRVPGGPWRRGCSAGHARQLIWRAWLPANRCAGGDSRRGAGWSVDPWSCWRAVVIAEVDRSA